MRRRFQQFARTRTCVTYHFNPRLVTVAQHLLRSLGGRGGENNTNEDIMWRKGEGRIRAHNLLPESYSTRSSY